MTKAEILVLDELRAQRRTFKLGSLAWSMSLILVFLLCGFFTVWPLPAFGIFRQNFFDRPLTSDARSGVSYNLVFTREKGFFFQVLEDTPVEVHVDGATVITRASLPRLEDILQDTGVELAPRDRVEARLVSGKIPEINVIRVRSRIVAVQDIIPPPVKKISDYNLPYGKVQVRSPGQPGLLLKKFEVVTENGVEIQRKELGSEVIKKPEPKIVAFGAAAPGVRPKTASRGDTSGERVRQVMSMVATAYTHTGSPTATGVWPHVGGVAVDPEVIPLGTKLYVEGYGPARAVDTGGLIKGRRIDLFFDTASECFAWGKKEVKVYVLE